MTKKNTSDMLVPLAVGAGVLLLFSQKSEGAVPKYTPQKFKGSIVGMYGFGNAIDKVAAVIRSWDVTKVSKKTAIDAAKKAVQWARASATALEGIGNYMGGLQGAIPLNYAKQIRTKATETEAYLAGQPSVERYKTALVNLLVFARPGISVFETLGTVAEEIAPPMYGVALLLDELYKIVKDVVEVVGGVVGGVVDFMKYLPYIALGIAGWWGYKNFIKERR